MEVEVPAIQSCRLVWGGRLNFHSHAVSPTSDVDRLMVQLHAADSAEGEASTRGYAQRGADLSMAEPILCDEEQQGSMLASQMRSYYQSQ